MNALPCRGSTRVGPLRAPQSLCCFGLKLYMSSSDVKVMPAVSAGVPLCIVLCGIFSCGYVKDYEGMFTQYPRRRRRVVADFANRRTRCGRQSFRAYVRVAVQALHADPNSNSEVGSEASLSLYIYIIARYFRNAITKRLQYGNNSVTNCYKAVTKVTKRKHMRRGDKKLSMKMLQRHVL